MYKYLLAFPLLLILTLGSCNKEVVEPGDGSGGNPTDSTMTDSTMTDTTMTDTTAMTSDPNPPAPGFDLLGSDSTAIAIVDSMMNAMGGRRNWDRSQYFGFTFSNINSWVWDRYTGNVRKTVGNKTVVVNINTLQGRVWNGSVEETDTAVANSDLRDTRDGLFNDSYWLFMPFKLKDDGVTLKYMGEETKEGIASYVIQLTFTNVGLTPDNKYLIYVDKSNYLMHYRDYFADFNNASPSLSTPWVNYQQVGYVKLALDRNFFITFSNVKAYENLPMSVFTDLTIPSLGAYEL